MNIRKVKTGYVPQKTNVTRRRAEEILVNKKLAKSSRLFTKDGRIVGNAVIRCIMSENLYSVEIYGDPKVKFYSFEEINEYFYHDHI